MSATAQARAFETGARLSWRVHRSFGDDCLSVFVWLSFAAVLYLISFPVSGPAFATPYALFIVYFAALYYRLLMVPLWARDTLDVLLAFGARPAPRVADPPLFLVFIAAYRAQASIVSVLESLNRQEYPRECYHVYVVTQEAESQEKREDFERLAKGLRAVLEDPGRRYWNSDIAIRVLSRVIAGSCGLGGPVASWRALSAALLICGAPKRRVRILLAQRIVADLLIDRHATGAPAACLDGLSSIALCLSARQRTSLARIKEQSFQLSENVLSDFSRILGGAAERPVRCDTAKLLRTAARLARYDRRTARAYGSLVRSISRRLGPFLAGVAREAEQIRASVAGLEDWEDQLWQIYDGLVRTCPETVERALGDFNRDNFHHICRSRAGGGKPESLNTAWTHVVSVSPQLLAGNTHVIVIDADSLLHAQTLSTVASEIAADPDGEAIRQIAPLSTSNYPGNNLFVQMIACLDTIGSMGKWARNTRCAERPDLPAGSGLVIPAKLMRRFEHRRGTPWEARSITEDARMVITDFGLLRGGRARTKFVPIHLLEAVPEANGYLTTFRQYWAQRMRWASGGPEEMLELIRAFRDPSRYGGSEECGSTVGLWLARCRHTLLLLRWLTDHFWWGAGYGLAPVIWMWFSFFHITPAYLRFAGLLLLLGSPAWVIFGVFRRFSPFVPGGLPWASLVRLYFATIAVAWVHTWPILYTQFMYATGRRSRFRTWSTTAKPQF